MTFYSHSKQETEDFAKELAQKTKAPHVFCLTGDLGAGKTAFTGGLAKGYGYEGRVTSPTFALMNIYEGSERVCHFDLYRLADEDEFYDAGLDAYIYDGIAAVEWPDNFMHLFRNVTVVKIVRGEGENERIITLEEVKD